MDVDREILDVLSPDKFQEWRVYSELEILPEQRADYRAADIVRTLLMIATQNPDIAELANFRLKFGDEIVPEEPKKLEKPHQSVEYLEMIIDGWCLVNNLHGQVHGYGT